MPELVFNNNVFKNSHIDLSDIYNFFQGWIHSEVENNKLELDDCFHL